MTPNFSLTPQANVAEGESERANAAHSSRRILVVGAGPVGHAWAKRLLAAGYTLRHWSRSQGPLWQESATREPADIVVFAVRDEAIAQAAQFLVEHGAAGPGSVLLHCAGALAADRQLPDAPPPMRAPRSYATMVIGAERPRQALGWWDRFQIADGVGPTLLRLAVAGSIVGSVIWASP